MQDVKVYTGVRCKGLYRCEMLKFTQVQEVKVYTGVRCQGLHIFEMSMFHRCEM